MTTRCNFFLTVVCVALLVGCSPKKNYTPTVSRFPEQPAQALAKPLEQGIAREVPRKNFLVQGGWGYQHSDAIVLSTPSKHSKKAYNNTVPLESLIVRARNHVEFSETPPPGQRYVVVDHGTIARTVSERNGKMYAVWRGKMHLLSERDSPDLYQEAVRLPLKHRATASGKTIPRIVSREYWFDVTDTFNIKPTKQTPKILER